MFGAPPQPTAEELQQQEAVAAQTVYGMVGMCFLLYISPFAVDAVYKFL